VNHYRRAEELKKKTVAWKFVKYLLALTVLGRKQNPHKQCDWSQRQGSCQFFQLNMAEFCIFDSWFCLAGLLRPESWLDRHHILA
jgi:hypothetical protein